MLKYISNSTVDTKNLAVRLALHLSAGDIICLFGNLGAGKTVFASGISSGMGVEDNICSPTFTILNEYDGRIPFYHFDVYRINSEEFLDMGGDEYLSGDGITLIEWPENISDVLPKERLEIYINYDGSSAENTREIVFRPIGQRYKEVIRKLSEVVN